jgi:hypothetical protein
VNLYKINPIARRAEIDKDFKKEALARINPRRSHISIPSNRKKAQRKITKTVMN